MRTTVLRAIAVLGVVSAIAACDTLPTSSKCASSDPNCSPGTPTPGLDTTAPQLVLDTPVVNAPYNVGDTLLVQAKVSDDKALKEFHVVGLTIKGNVALGTATETARYPEVKVTLSGPGPIVIRRGLVPATPLDTTVDSLVIRAWVIDSAGHADTVQRTVKLTTGPKITIVAPTASDTSFLPGNTIAITAIGTQPLGLDSIRVHAVSSSGWASPLDSTFTKASSGKQVDTLNAAIRLPTNAPDKGVVTITATARDQLGQTRDYAVRVIVCASCIPGPPQVLQTVALRSEYTDGVTVSASSKVGVTWVGVVVSDSVDTPASVRRDSVAVARLVTNDFPANLTRTLPLFPDGSTATAAWSDSLRLAQQGKRLRIRSFARDSLGNIGYSTVVGAAVPTTATAARMDSVIVAYGRTYPLLRPGTAGDLAVDTIRGQVFVSNTSYNLVEVWNDVTKTFASSAVPVGSRPWGLFVANNPDTLLVANSGATTISRVYIGATTTGAAGIHEALAGRILTRNSFVFQATQTLGTSKITWAVTGPYSYSDRPQYIAQSAAGRLFFSTVPTPTAPDGTVRWLDPKFSAADARMIHSYATYLNETGSSHSFAIFNADSVWSISFASGASDFIAICDHPINTTLPAQCASATDADSARMLLNQKLTGLGEDTSDVEIVARLDVKSLGLSDTTYAAASGDRKWVAFGEGNVPDSGRVTMVYDPSAAVDWPPFFSPLVTTHDLTENASERVNGIALNTAGPGCTAYQCYLVAAHGSQSYVAYVDNPYHLRLGGLYDSFDNGAGIAFHPEAADPPSTPQDKRIAFTASTSGSIEIFDVAYFNNRGTLTTKYGLYGPLRATKAVNATETAKGIVMKLYTLTPQGLLVIDLQAKDIKPGVP